MGGVFYRRRVRGCRLRLGLDGLGTIPRIFGGWRLSAFAVEDAGEGLAVGAVATLQEKLARHFPSVAARAGRRCRPRTSNIGLFAEHDQTRPKERRLLRNSFCSEPLIIEKPSPHLFSLSDWGDPNLS